MQIKKKTITRTCSYSDYKQQLVKKLLTFAYRLLYTPPTCKKKEWIKTNIVIVDLV